MLAHIYTHNNYINRVCFVQPFLVTCSTELKCVLSLNGMQFDCVESLKPIFKQINIAWTVLLDQHKLIRNRFDLWEKVEF